MQNMTPARQTAAIGCATGVPKSRPAGMQRTTMRPTKAAASSCHAKHV
jgi:hypothetical protein